MTAEQSDTGSGKELRRKAHFRMIDGSPSFTDWQQRGESLEDFAARVAREIKTGGGYVSLAGVALHEISDDPDTAAMIEGLIDAETEQ